ncbi:family 1 glycosylhydrolase [Yinghuangia sp. KLBMP8922]|uniref:Family 1 glycosylhydrolase n=1 Tax=Yinghuangia soli TaxID=2908204 RepID=A0AA41Q4U8_9ACTN|nr:family 1 glycosylhydrolase [Yinghuangia soli]MCF2531573.1 family 1 glycosylhydrolase [Yinghuangia soli]
MPAGFRWPAGFLFGASTAPHQVEGNNTSSDMWAFERAAGPGHPLLKERSGDAVDSYHRWPEDMDLLAGLGFSAYRFGIEWARIEPEQGHVSRAAVAHYRAMVRGALDRGLTPVVTLHHFTSPLWFTARGGWTAPDAPELFAAYATTAAEILGEGVEYVATLNEPNMIAVMQGFLQAAASGAADPSGSGSGTDLAAAAAAAADPEVPDRHIPGQEHGAVAHGLPAPDPAVTEALIRAHRAARAALKAADPRLKVGWTVANQVYQAEPGAEAAAAAYSGPREDVFLAAAREDDWVGVQAYTRTRIGPDGPLPAPADAERTLTGWEFYPPSVGHAIRHTAGIVGPDVPILVTENGIATADDTRRVAYTSGALAAVAEAVADGIDVRGYLHWSALDNYEWGSYRPTFGLIAVDRETFERTPKESARLLGALAAAARTAPTDAPDAPAG